VAKASLESGAFSHSGAAEFREDLMNIARTTLSSKILTQVRAARAIALGAGRLPPGPALLRGGARAWSKA
jgi:hypothetical protein